MERPARSPTTGNFRASHSEGVRIPVVASGGAGTTRHLVDVFERGYADAAIIASMIHTGEFTIEQIKRDLIAADVPVRRRW